MRRVIGSFLLAVLLGAFIDAAAQLPPEIMADRYLVEAEQLIAKQNYKQALELMNKIVALQEEHNFTVPDVFHFKYAQVALSAGSYQAAIDAVNRYLAAVGREGRFYREALEILVQAEQEEEVRRRQAEERRRQAEERRRQAEAERNRIEAERRRVEAVRRSHDELVQRQLEAAAVPFPRDTLRSGGQGPEMVTVASGRFAYRQGTWVEFDRSFAVSKYEVTRGEFKRFVERTRYKTEAQKDPKHGCSGNTNSTKKNSLRWNRHQYDQTDEHPVVCVSIRDAIAYAEWLSRETGHTYRVPSPAEWRYAYRAGMSSAMPRLAPFESRNSKLPCESGNFSRHSCTDGYSYTAPVGSFTPNAIGIYDMDGNVSELLRACTSDDAPADGSPQHPSSCGEDDWVKVAGNDWSDAPFWLYVGNVSGGVYIAPHRRSEIHFGDKYTYYRRSSRYNVGFRVVRDLQD